MKIIVAVSGGVDSIVMLHGLLNNSAAFINSQFSIHNLKNEKLMPNEKRKMKNSDNLELIVAHVDHGLREDSAADSRFVAALADKYELEFEQTRLELDDSSEATARAGRWQFLREVKAKHGADVIATAHHQDDVIETMLINLLRGTNRKGLTSLRQRPEILRPLLSTTKQQIYAYALEQKLEWVRDETNVSDEYLRNRVRRYLVPQLTDTQRQKLLKIYSNLTRVNQNLDQTLQAAAATLTQPNESRLRIETSEFAPLEDRIKRELFATWWYQLQASPPPDSLQLERMVAAVNLDKTGNLYQLANCVRLEVGHDIFEIFQKTD